MEKFTHFRCMGCKIIKTLEFRVNNHWVGWDKDGNIKKVDNHCCPDCGSNDLIYRSPGVDG